MVTALGGCLTVPWTVTVQLEGCEFHLSVTQCHCQSRSIDDVVSTVFTALF